MPTFGKPDSGETEMTESGGASAALSNDRERMESWKEIAAYLKREVRTVQRWEKYEGLPVYRHQHQKRGSVYALKSELDAWRGTRAFQPDRLPEPGRGQEPDAFPAAPARLSNRLLRRAAIAGAFACGLVLLAAGGYLAGRYSERQMSRGAMTPASVIVVAGDFNGDGKLDLAVAQPFSNSISIFFGSSDGHFASQGSYSIPGTITGMAAADFNRDGKVDLAVATDRNRITVLLADSQTAFRRGQEIPVPHVSTISAGDFNGNGKVDLVASGGDPSSFYVLWGQGDGSFASPEPASEPSAASAAAIVSSPVEWIER